MGDLDVIDDGVQFMEVEAIGVEFGYLIPVDAFVRHGFLNGN
jgi:hypothetical protein